MTEFEFSDKHNQIIIKVGRRLRYVGIIFMIVAVGDLISAITRVSNEGFALVSISYFVSSILVAIFGIVLYRPSDNFIRIATTSGNDISELMTALSELRQAFIVSLIVSVLGTINQFLGAALWA